MLKMEEFIKHCKETGDMRGWLAINGWDLHKTELLTILQAYDDVISYPLQEEVIKRLEEIYTEG